MDSLEREVLDAARYVRAIRPVDPAEITGYLTIQTSPDVVRSVLREHAAELSLIEASDGTFKPVPEGPITAQVGSLDRLPPRLESAVDGYLTERHGEDWTSGTRGDRLRARIRDLKERYLEGGSISYDSLDTDAYLLYHLPRIYAATTYVMAELLEAKLLSHELRLLDVGAGVGPHLAAIDDLTPDDALIDYDAVEPSPLADHLVALTERYVGLNTHVSIYRDTFEAVEMAGQYDVVLLGNLLSEVDDPEGLAYKALDYLTDDGSLVAIAPADPRTSMQLREVERALESTTTVFSPTIRLWPSRQPSDACWSFVEQPSLVTPTFQSSLAADADEREPYLNTEVRYSYSIMRHDGRRRYDITADESVSLPLERATDAIGERVDTLAVKLSGDLSTDGNPIYRLGDGSQAESCFAAHVAKTELNNRLASAPYGAVLHFERTLVLWNDDEEAINLVVDDETFVEQRAP